MNRKMCLLACGTVVLFFSVFLVPSSAPAKTEIQWWHAHTGFLGERVTDLVTKFNAGQGDYEIKAVYKGSYPEVLTAAIAALFVVMFIYGWNQYLWPLMATNSDNMRVVVVGIASTVPTGTQLPEWNLVMAAAMMALVPPVLVVICLQRWFVHGLLETEK